MDVFRADWREPWEIRTTGFVARQPLSEPVSHLLEFCNGKRGNPNDLTEWIIRSPKPTYVSTDVRQDCGGQTAGRRYIYKISVNVAPVDWSEDVTGIDFGSKSKSKWPTLYLDSDTLKDAKVICLKHARDTEEVTFLTKIPVAKIVECRRISEPLNTFYSIDDLRWRLQPPKKKKNPMFAMWEKKKGK